MAQRTVLLTGGAGYVATASLPLLLQRGYHVRVLDAFLYSNSSALNAFADDPRVEILVGDLCHKETLTRALEGVTDVIHLAALVGDPICKKASDLARSINEAGSKELFDSLLGRRIQRFIFVSTCSNYGLVKDDLVADETSPLNPQSLYAETKVRVEEYIQSKASEVDFCPVILRLSTAYGVAPRMRFDLTVSEFAREIALGRELVVFDAKTWRPYCHVQDIARMFLAVLDAPQESVKGEVFNVGTEGENYTKEQIIAEIGKYLDISKVQFKAGGGDPRNYRVSFQKAASVLKFSPVWTVADYVPRIVRSIQSGVFSDVEDRRDFYGNYSISQSRLVPKQ